MSKTVLIPLEDRNRLTSSGSKEDLIKEIWMTFKDVLGETSKTSELVLQIKDELWQGLFVDVMDQDIPDRSVLKAKVKVKSKAIQPELVCIYLHFVL